MRLRTLAGLALTLGITLLLGYLHLNGRGPFATLEARHLREMKERLDAPLHAAPMTHAMIAALPSSRPVAEYSAIESHGAQVEGYIQRMFYSADGDLHLEVTPAPCAPNAPDTIYITAEVTLPLRHRHPGWTFASLERAFRPASGSGPLWEMRGPRVRLTGWLLYDFQYDGVTVTEEPLRLLWYRFGLRHPYRPSGPRSIWPRLSGWEIHPVTRIEVWDDSLAGFRELPA